MTFLHPEFLYLMLPPVLLLFYFILTQKDPTAELFDSGIYTRLLVNEKRLSLRQRNIIYLIALVLLITAMAQPVITEAKIRVKAPEKTLSVALDISASMQTGDLYPSRLAVAKAKLLQLIDAAEAERIGILAFGKDVYAVSPPSSDKAVLRQMTEHFKPDAYAEEGTDLMALLAAARSVTESGTRLDLLLMTDGGDRPDFSDAIAFAKASNIRLFVLGTATPEGAPLEKKGSIFLPEGKPVVTRLNPALRELAEETGGAYRSADAGSEDVAALMAAWRGSAERGADGVKEINRYGQLFILPLGLALLLLLVATSSLSRRQTIAVPPAFLLGLLLLGNGVAVRAEPFDYELLGEAKALYASKQYARAANAFYRYAKRSDNDPRALYDSAHALYRAGNYEAAAALWGRIRPKERRLQFDTLHNLGNAHAMLGGEEHLQAAIKAYQRALYLQNDPQTRENLEIVRGRLMRLMREKLGLGNGAVSLPPQRGANADGLSRERTTGDTGVAKREDGASDEGGPKPSEASGEAVPQRLSDFEAAMWMKRLQRQSQTHLYRITPSSAEGGRNADPW